MAKNQQEKPVTSNAADELVQRAKARSERSKAEALFQSASDARKRYDWEWLSRDLFRRGYQFSRYSQNNKSIVLQTRSNARIPINITNAQMRTIKNQITSVQPKWEILPQGLSEDAITNARYSGKLLDHYYLSLNLRRLLKETVIQGLMYSVGGPWEIGYDPNGGDDGMGDIYIWLIDPFDFYIDPNATSINDAEYVVKAVRTSLNSIKANPKYKFYTDPMTLGSDARRAASEYKQFLLQAIQSYTPRMGESEQEGTILKQAWIKVHVEEDKIEDLSKELAKFGEDNKNLKPGEVIMKHITYVDSLEDPLEFKLVRRKSFPYSIYQADVNPMEVYGESWIKHVIPMNRVLNALESSVFKYNYKYAVGRIVIDKNSGVRIFSNEHGDIVEKNAGSEVSSLPLQGLPSSYQQQISNMRMYIEDVGGAHEVSMGRVPGSVTSGIGIAELKAADAVNQQDLIDGLEEFLIDVGYKVLGEIAQNFDVPHLIKALGKTGKPEYFTVIGEDFVGNRKNKKEVKIGLDSFDLAVIGNQNEIRVTVGSWLNYSKGARMEQLKQLFSAGLIDQQTFLEYSEFADVDGIIKRSRQEELLKKFRGTVNPQAGDVSDEEIAQQENYMMASEGRTDVEPMPDDNHQIHIAIHQQQMGMSGNPIVEAHIQKHVEYIRQGLKTPARPEAINPPANVAPVTPAEPTGMAPQMAPQPGIEAVQPTAPAQEAPAAGSPEEAALMARIMEITGGQ